MGWGYYAYKVGTFAGSYYVASYGRVGSYYSRQPPRRRQREPRVARFLEDVCRGR